MGEIEKPKINHLLNRRVFFGILFLLITILVLALVRPYLNVIIFSLTIVMLLRTVYTRIYDWKWVQNFRASKGLATALTIIAFILVIAIPVTILAVLTFSQVKALSIAFSVLPLVGISLIVLPMSIILILNGDVTSAIIVLIGFYGFANWIDTLLRPKLVPKGAYLHPMLLILSVFGGLGLVGILGVVYGPVIMIVFVTTIELYRTYFLGIGRPEEGNNEVVLSAK